VRNSGAIAVVEGTGDHCCEYMTGGIIMVLGNTGVNFGAGMSGGIAYVYDNDKSFAKRCNTSMVEIIELNSENPSSSENLFNKQTYLENDEKRIREMLMRHINYTNSQVAKKIIENFSGEIQNFVKVLPLDFKAALKKSKIEVKKEKDRLWQK
jgi:glutamate synthase (NADPH/NADH) large chain